jgi:hypothetical protein
MSIEKNFVGQWVDRRFPISDEDTDMYRALTGLWIIGAAACGWEVIDDVMEHSSAIAADPVRFGGKVALAAATLKAATFFWNRSWQSQGE